MKGLGEPASYIEKFRQVLLYGGLPKAHFTAISHMINDRNLRILRIATILMAIYGLLSLLRNHAILGVYTGDSIYFAMATLAWLLYALSYTQFAEKHGTLLLYFFLLLGLSNTITLPIMLGRFTTPAVSYLVMICALPLMIADSLWRMAPVTVGFSSFYLFIDKLQKPVGAFQYDLRNVAIFSVFGLILYALISCSVIQEIYQKFRVSRLQEDIIVGMAELVEDRDKNTGNHIHRTTNLVARIVIAMRQNPLYKHIMTKSYSSDIIQAAALHDIGKIRIPDAILNKPGRLTDEEYEMMKNHSRYGANMIESIIRKVEEPEYYRVARNITLYHHERIDGKGYPEGLNGTEIPLEARIMAVADVYDALRSPRVYKPGFSKEKATAIMEEGRGSQFDATICDIFLDLIKDHDGYETES